MIYTLSLSKETVDKLFNDSDIGVVTFVKNEYILIALKALLKHGNKKIVKIAENISTNT